MIKNCTQCGLEFKSKSGNHKAKYCSRKCASTSRIIRVGVKCATCNNPILKASKIKNGVKYCSRECFLKKIEHKIIRTCLLCDSEFVTTPYRDKKLCSRLCAGLARSKELRETIKTMEIESSIKSNIETIFTQESSWSDIHIENIFELSSINIDEQLNAKTYVGSLKRRY